MCEILLWIIIVGCAVGGYLIASNGGSDKAIIGGIIGVVIGLVICIFSGGFIATFLEMGHDLAMIKDAIAKNNTPATSASPITVPDVSMATSDVPADSVLITSGQTVSGVISHKNGRELFQVVLTQPGKLSIEVTTDDEDGLPHWDSRVNVLGTKGKKINTSGQFEFPYRGEVDLQTAGTYVIEITSAKTGRFYLTVTY
ncbi:hypothetical protein R80B4_02854 [Fibrobacteres bacterium R8-0-B4]